MKILLLKKWKFENFEQNLCYAAQKKLRTCRIQIQIEKLWIFEKKISFLIFFVDFFPTLWCQNSKFSFFNFLIFHISFFINSFTWTKRDTEMNKVMNFSDFSHKTVEMRDCFWSPGAKMAPLSWNRVNQDYIKIRFRFSINTHGQG